MEFPNHDMEVILAGPNPTTFDYLLKLASRERRDGKREACQLEGQCRPMDSLQLSAAWPVTIRDIGAGGCQLLLSRRFEPGTLLVVDVHDGQGQPAAAGLAQREATSAAKCLSAVNNSDFSTLAGRGSCGLSGPCAN